MYTRNSTGGMVPLGSIMDVQRITGPDSVSHYNVYPAALIQGATLPGISSGQAIEKMERICRENLPSQFSFEWTQLTYQQVTAGNSAILIFPLCVLFVFLALARGGSPDGTSHLEYFGKQNEPGVTAFGDRAQNVGSHRTGRRLDVDHLVVFDCHTNRE
jgi:hypothetical protein